MRSVTSTSIDVSLNQAELFIKKQRGKKIRTKINYMPSESLANNHVYFHIAQIGTKK